MADIDELKTAAYDRVRLLDRDVPAELADAYAQLGGTAVDELGVSPADVDTWLACLDNRLRAGIRRHTLDYHSP